MSPQPPHVTAGPRIALRSSIGEGLRYVRSNQALMGSFAIDLVAMTFGMPRALFAVLAVSVYAPARRAPACSTRRSPQAPPSRRSRRAGCGTRTGSA